MNTIEEDQTGLRKRQKEGGGSGDQDGEHM